MLHNLFLESGSFSRLLVLLFCPPGLCYANKRRFAYPFLRGVHAICCLIVHSPGPGGGEHYAGLNASELHLLSCPGDGELDEIELRAVTVVLSRRSGISTR